MEEIVKNSNKFAWSTITIEDLKENLENLKKNVLKKEFQAKKKERAKMKWAETR